MRGGIIATLVFAALLVSVVPATAGQRVDDPQSMTLTASSHEASAQRVRLAVTLSYQMQCNYPGAGPLVITFPKAVKLPKHLASGAVTLAGKPIAAVVSGRQVTVTIKPHDGALCGIVGPGLLKLVFTPKAKLANPSRTGSYRFSATHAPHTFAAKLHIS